VPPQPVHAVAAAGNPAAAADTAMSGGRTELAPAESLPPTPFSAVAGDSSSPKPLVVDDASSSHPPLAYARAAAVRHRRETRGGGPSIRHATQCWRAVSFVRKLVPRGGAATALEWALALTMPTESLTVYAAVPPSIAARGRVTCAGTTHARCIGESEEHGRGPSSRHATTQCCGRLSFTWKLCSKC